MHSARTKSETEGRLNAALILAVSFALTLIAARPAEARTETVLYNFTGASDGGFPYAGLTPDGAGDFFGTTPFGGLRDRYDGYGIVFELSPNGNGGWNETVLYTFTGGADGGAPVGSVLFDSMGNLYGTACCGGANGRGVVFELSRVETSWTETVLYSFAGGADGENPETGLILDSAGNLYGTTLGCCGGQYGTVFELSPSGGGWKEQVIYSVETTSYANLSIDALGNIFGIGNDSVFELSPNGRGGWNPTVLHTFPSSPKDGDIPQGTLVWDKAGNLYGTTEYGGAEGVGTVYKLSHVKEGWKEKILYSFKGGKKDGSNPFAGIVLDAAGNIYGTTVLGGKYGDKYGDGTLFELKAPVGKGRYKERVFLSFDGRDGESPDGNLFLDGSGNIYGTTYYGGSSDFGVVFEVTRRARQASQADGESSWK
jgi:uncharacterized repeat protein (TIGR03803 family)